MVSYAKFKDEYCNKCFQKTFVPLINCSFCDMQACSFCVSKHMEGDNNCPNKPPPTESELKSREVTNEWFEKQKKAATEVSDDPEQNCCQCGYKRHRNIITWSIFIYPSKNDFCGTCGGEKCRACIISDHYYNHNKNRPCQKNVLKTNPDLIPTVQ